MSPWQTPCIKYLLVQSRPDLRFAFLCVLKDWACQSIASWVGMVRVVLEVVFGKYCAGKISGVVEYHALGYEWVLKITGSWGFKGDVW